jgi:hypothetical protein
MHEWGKDDVVDDEDSIVVIGVLCARCRFVVAAVAAAVVSVLMLLSRRSSIHINKSH